MNPAREQRSLPSFPSIHRGLRALALILSLGVCGCASRSGEGGLLNKAMEMVGLAKPPPKMMTEGTMPVAATPKQVTLRLHAGQALNTDGKGQSLSVVARIYKLRGYAAFSRMPYEAFKESGADAYSLGTEVVEMREVILTPGQRYDVVETLPPAATHIAVVALLRSPDPQRWRFIFDAAQAARTGITIGAHACALSVAEGEPLLAAPESRRLAGVHCR